MTVGRTLNKPHAMFNGCAAYAATTCSGSGVSYLIRYSNCKFTVMHM